MGSEREFLARLAAADQSLGEQRLPPAAVRRIATRISGELSRGHRAGRLGWVPMVTFAAGAGLVLLFVAWANFGRQAAVADPPAIARSSAASTVASVVVSGPDCQRDDDDGVALRGACQVVTTEPAMRIDTTDGARVRVQSRVLRVEAGSAVFDVDKVVGAPVRVLVPGGEIEVIGTRFRVGVDAGHTRIDLYEGRLRFVADDGRSTPIEAGERLEVAPGTFAKARAVVLDAVPAAAVGAVEIAAEPSVSPTPDAAPAVVPEVEPTAPPRVVAKPAEPKPAEPKPAAAGPSASASASAAALIETVQELQRSGDYEGAAALQQALDTSLPRRTAEVLSNELGRILARRIGDPVRACAHWKRHLERFENTRYRAQIETSRQRLGCE